MDHSNAPEEVSKPLQQKISDAGLGPSPGDLSKSPEAFAKEVLEHHLERKPVALMIVSVTEGGGAQADCTPFPSLSVHAFCQKLLNQFVDEGFTSALMRGRKAAGPT